MRKLAVSAICIFFLIALALNLSALGQVIPISTVEELYSAVNDPAKAGATLVLSPGTYMLSDKDPNGVLRPKDGRIELQPDMSLIGVEGDRTAVVINAFNLPASSFPQTGGPSAAVRMGLGHNALEWLTVRDARNGQANIDSGLQPLDPGTAFLRVAHVASTGSTRGLNVQNFGPQTSGQTLEADIIDCYFFDNDFNISQGIRIGNFQGAVGSIVNVRMSGNQSWGQKSGRLIVNNNAAASMVNVESSGNRFYGNGVGTVIGGGFSTNNLRSDGNTIDFVAHGDQFLNNNGETEFDRGGLVVLATDNTSPGTGGGTNNTVNIKLWGCRRLDNTNSDLTGIGARSLSQSAASLSQNNHVTIEIHGDGNGNGKWQPVELFADQLPATPNYGNSMTVVR